VPGLAAAADFNGGQLGGWWAVPFAGMLLSIALMPLLLPALWHAHFGKISAGWALAFLLPFGAIFGAATAGTQFVHALVAEYLPFIILLTALYTWRAASACAATCTAPGAEHRR
jgi:Na+/H+ antiporter NhaD/arsenite permease-like protein